MLSQGRVTDETHRQQCYDLLSRESERLERLVEDVLDFGRLESGAYQYRFERVDLSGLVRAVVSEFQREAGPKGYRVEASLPVEPALVLADEAALSRVIRNLLDNAVKYSPGTDRIWVTLALGQDAVVVRVRDRGLGIAADEQQRIFTKFVRGSNARMRQIKGTGIGLAMAHEIVRAHSGEITVESEPGVGSTFVVSLPVADAAAVAGSQQKGRSTGTGSSQHEAETPSLVQDGLA
jgi:signal transduction histidine kinase